MKNTQGALSFDAYIGDTDFNRTIQSMNQRIIGLSNTAKSESKKMESSFASMGQLAAGAFATIGLAQLPAQIVKVRGEFQQLEIAFGTMLQSKSKADKLMADVTKFAALTPYGLKDTAAATKQLLAYGESADTVIATMTKLGDIASGIGAPLGEIAYLYGTTMTQGRLYTQDLNQFTGRGIPMIRELANIFKVAESEVKGLVEAGKVGFPEVQKVIENLTKSGSMFGGLMEAQSKSLGGLQAQLGDAVDAMFNDIGRSQEGLISETLKGAIGVVENYEKVIDVLKVVVATYGTYRAALMLTAAVQSSALIISEAQAFFALARSIKTAADAQALFNIATRANPYVLAATAIMALVTAYTVFGDEASQAEKIQRSLADSMKAAEDAAAGEQAKIMVLTSQIKDETKSRESRNKKLQELIQLSPTHLNALTLENIATADGTKAIGDYIEAKKKQIELKEIEAQLEGSIKRQNEARNGQNDLSMWDKIALSASASSGVGDYSKNAASERKRLNGEIAQSEDQLQKKLIERIGIITGVGEATKKTGEVVAKVSAKTVENYNEEIKALKDKQEKSASSAEYKALDNQIKSLEKARDRITGGKVAKVAEKDKPQPFGSLAYYEQVARKADEIIAKTPGSNVSEITRQNQIKIEAEKKADEIRKLTAVKTFEDELEEKKKAYQLYQRWVDNYGQESADKQFEVLISSNKSYVAYLDQEIKKLESLQNFTTLNKKDSEALLNLQSERTEATGGPSKVDQFRDSLERAREQTATLTEYIGYLKQAQDSLNAAAPTSNVIEQRKVAAEMKIEAEKQRKDLLSQFLLNTEQSEEKRIEIESHYADLRNALEEKNQGEKTQAYFKALDLINKAESKELAERKIKTREASEEYQALVKAVENAASSNGLFDQIKKQKDLVASLLASEGYSDTYMQEQRKLSAMQSAMYTQIAGAVGELGEALQNVGGTVGDIGRALAGIASQGSNLVTVFDKNASATQKWGSAAQAVGNLISIVASSAKQRKDAEAEYFRSVIAYQSEYNLMINEQIRLQGEAGDSVFVKDYAGRIKGAQDSLSDATDKYQDALDKLDQGRAKTGQKNGIDWKAVGAGAASGATIGGIAGAGVFSWATAAIGAVGGAIVGLIGGLKKKDKYAPLLEEYKDLVQVGADGVEYLNVEIAKILISTNRVDEDTKALLQNAIDLQEQMNEAKAVILDIISTLAGQLGDSLRDNLVGAFIEGTNAGEAMFKSLNKSLASFLEQMIFSQVFSKRLKQFETEMAQSLGEGGDGDVTDDYGRLFSDAGALGTQYFDMLNSAKDEAKKHGFDLWAKDSSTADRAKGLTGAIQGMSQETASLLAGQFNALRISGADSANSLRQILIYQANISRNSDYQKNLTLLVEINAGIKDLNKNPLRASGL